MLNGLVILFVILLIAVLYLMYISAKCDQVREDLFNDRIDSFTKKRGEDE